MLPYLSMDMYMFQEVNYELQETDSVQGQVIIQVCFCAKWKFLWLSSNIFAMYKTKYLQATHCLLHFRVLHVSINKKIFPFFCNNRKNLSQHEIQNRKKTFMVFDARLGFFYTRKTSFKHTYWSLGTALHNEVVCTSLAGEITFSKSQHTKVQDAKNVFFDTTYQC